MTKDEQLAATQDHIMRVQQRIITLLMQRARNHDKSKLEEPEATGYAELATALQSVKFGTQAYRDTLATAHHTLVHHYAQNTHHPEHWPAGIDDMSLLDIIEMFCDWKAASERARNGSGSILSSIAYSVERFNISPQLQHILENTARELGWT